MYYTILVLIAFAHFVAPLPGFNQVRQEPSCTLLAPVTTTVTATSVPPAITITTSVCMLVTITVTAPATPTTTSTSIIPSPPSGTCISPPTTLPDGGLEEQVPWLGQPPNSINALWTYNNQHSGMRALQLSVSTRGASGQWELWQSITVCPGRMYNFRAWAKTPDTAAGCKITWILNGTAFVLQEFSTTEYELVTATWVAPVPLPAVLILKISLQCSTTATVIKMVYLDDISLQLV